MNIPEPTVARGRAIGAPMNAVYSSAPQTAGQLVAVSPPPQAHTMSAERAKQRRVLGLVPAQAGSMHTMIVREGPREKTDPREVSKTRAELRVAKRAAQVAEHALLAVAGPDLRGSGSDEYKTALVKSRDANDLAAALVRRLAEYEAASTSRPTRVAMAKVREPSEAGDQLGADTHYVCLHDGCRSHTWPDEATLRRAHPTDAEMRRAQQCHVYVVVCDAPLDPLDPEGERIGYVAPVGTDGTTVQMARAEAIEEDETAEDVATLKAQVAKLEAMVAEMAKSKK